MIKTRPRRPLDVYAPALDAPLPLFVTCTGMRLPWPSGSPAADTPDVRAMPLCRACGGYADACQCDAPGTPPPDWEPDTENADNDLFASDAYDTWPTLAERLADSILDDCRA